MYNDKSTKSVADAVAKILEASTPKTEKEKDLAALGHPKDKITHKDVLIGRGVLKKEEAEQLDELSKGTLGSYIKKASGEAVDRAHAQANAENRSLQFARWHGDKKWKRMTGIRKAADKLTKEEVEETLPFTSMLESYAQGGMKAFFENFVVQEEFEQVEEEATSDEFVSELEKAKRKAAGKEKNEVSKAAVQAVQNEEVEQLDEISLDTMKSAKSKLAQKASEYHYDDNKRWARQYAARALNMGSKIRKKEMALKKEEVELDEMALSADHKAALKTLKSIPSNYSHDDLKKLQAHLSDLHSKASDAERTARHAKQAEVRKANKDRSLKVTHELEGRSANYTNDDGHRLHITRDKNTGGYHAHVSNAKGKYVDSGGKTTLMYNHKVGKYAKHFKEEVDHDQED